MAKTKLTKAHKLYLLQEVAQFNTSPAILRKNLQDIEICEKYDFKPVDVCYSRMHLVVNSFTEQEVALKRAKYLTNFDKIPLAFKKNRLMELQKMYESLCINSANYGKGVMRMKLDLLNQMAKETNEDFDKLIDAINNNNNTGDVVTYNVTYNNYTTEQQKTINDNLATGFGRMGVDSLTGL